MGPRNQVESIEEDILRVAETAGSKGVLFSDLMDLVPGFSAGTGGAEQIYLPTLVACPHEAVEDAGPVPFARYPVIAWRGHRPDAQAALLRLLQRQALWPVVVAPEDYPDKPRPFSVETGDPLPAVMGVSPAPEEESWVPLKLVLTELRGRSSGAPSNVPSS